MKLRIAKIIYEDIQFENPIYFKTVHEEKNRETTHFIKLTENWQWRVSITKEDNHIIYIQLTTEESDNYLSTVFDWKSISEKEFSEKWNFGIENIQTEKK